jgi:hypothetical protein
MCNLKTCERLNWQFPRPSAQLVSNYFIYREKKGWIRSNNASDALVLFCTWTIKRRENALFILLSFSKDVCCYLMGLYMLPGDFTFITVNFACTYGGFLDTLQQNFTRKKHQVVRKMNQISRYIGGCARLSLKGWSVNVCRQ